MYSFRNYIFLIIFLITVLFQSDLNAKHIIGGEITYECLGVDTIRNEVKFRIHTTIWRDDFGGGAQFDRNFNFGVYYHDEITKKWIFVDEADATFVPLCCQKYLNVNENDPCVLYPKNVSVQEGKYDFDITLPIRNSNYMIVFQRCCRNESITNLLKPGENGVAYTVEISAKAQMVCNNSPVFKNFPPIVICKDFPLNFDHSATDAEGDILVYEFCSPLHAGGRRGTNGFGRCRPNIDCDCVIPDVSICPPPYSNVSWKSPEYTPSAPLKGSPLVKIDGNTGLITGIPRINGQFVVGVCVSEYRNGELLSKIRRDFQFNVTDCDPLVVADIKHDDIENKKYVINSCGENTVSFLNESYSKRYIQTYEWQFVINGQNEIVHEPNATFTFPDTGRYEGVMIINKGLACSDTARIVVNIYPDITADFEYDYDTCNPTPVLFYDKSVSGAGPIVEWNWDFGDGGLDNIKDPKHQFNTPGKKNILLKVRDQNECVDKVEKEIQWYPVPTLIVIDPSNFRGCKPASIKFLNLSEPIDESYDVIWDFGDGTTVNEISPTHIFEEEGNYTIKIDITSPLGCMISTEYTGWITIVDKPEAEFVFSPEKLTNFNKKVKFTDQSIRTTGWQWLFDNAGTIFDQHPTHTFRDTGVHEIKLIAFHENGCTDTIIKYIDVVPSVTYYMPNAFTPNGDGKNDFFKGIGYTDGISNFKMSIWNRWGEEIFHSTNPENGWNGLYKNEGISVPSGVYLYTIEYDGPRGESQVLKGYATLIR